MIRFIKKGCKTPEANKVSDNNKIVFKKSYKNIDKMAVFYSVNQ